MSDRWHSVTFCIYLKWFIIAGKKFLFRGSILQTYYHPKNITNATDGILKNMISGANICRDIQYSAHLDVRTIQV
jgi:hypothetical protein